MVGFSFSFLYGVWEIKGELSGQRTGSMLPMRTDRSRGGEGYRIGLTWGTGTPRVIGRKYELAHS